MFDRLKPRPPVGACSFQVLALIAFLLPLLALGCGGSGSSTEGTDPRARADRPSGADGPSPPRRIVSLAPNLTEILFALGVGDRVVGVTDYCNFPPEAAKRPKVGGFVNPNPEVIISLAPDLVVATPNVGNRRFVERIVAVGSRVELVEARNVAEIFPAIDAIARACGVEENGRALTASIRSDLERERARVRGLAPVRVLFCLQVDPLMAAGRGSYPGDLIELAGGENVVPASAGAYPNLSLEEVIRQGPDVIVQSLMDPSPTGGGPIQGEGPASSALLAYWARHRTIPAVRTLRVHALAGDVLLRPGPRVAQGAAALIAILHPEAAQASSASPEGVPGSLR